MFASEKRHAFANIGPADVVGQGRCRIPCVSYVEKHVVVSGYGFADRFGLMLLHLFRHGGNE